MTQTLELTLDGAFSWTRAKALPGVIPTKYGSRPRVGYSDDVVAHRALWAQEVRKRVRAVGWTIGKKERYGVRIEIHAGGRLDSDRVMNAVLDALQNGGAIREDAVVDEGSWKRVRRPKSVKSYADTFTNVWVTRLAS